MLQTAKVNSTFNWNGAALQSLGRSIIYVTTDRQHLLKFDRITNSEEVIENQDASESSPIPIIESNAIQSVAETSNVDSLPELQRTLRSESGYRSQLPSLYDDYVSILSSDEEAADLQEALQASKVDEKENKTRESYVEDEYTLEESIITIQSKIDELQVNLFNVNRKRLLEGATRAITRTSFKEEGRISVNFSDDIGKSEGAIDAGGPTREFLRLAVHAVVNSNIFEGTETNKYLTKCKTATEKDCYFIYGRIFALAIIHGGSGPFCFSKLLYKQIVDLPRDYPIRLLQPSAIYDQLNKIENSATEDEFWSALDDASVLLQTAGVFNRRFAEKELLVKHCAHFFLEDRVRSELDRFIAGLDCLNLVQEMKKCPTLYEELFLFKESELSAIKLLDDVFGHIELSEIGSNSRSAEDDTICYWRDYVVEMEDGTTDSTPRFTHICNWCRSYTAARFYTQASDQVHQRK